MKCNLITLYLIYAGCTDRTTYLGADTAPCRDITISDFSMWTEAGSTQKYICRSAYGSGFCLHSGSSYSSYTTTSTVSAAP